MSLLERPCWEEVLQVEIGRSPFNLKKAIELSDNLHAWEAAGGELTTKEDGLWELLTYRIEAEDCEDYRC